MIEERYSVNTGIYFLVVFDLNLMSHYVVCWQAGFSTVPAVFLVCIAVRFDLALNESRFFHCSLSLMLFFCYSSDRELTRTDPVELGN